MKRFADIFSYELGFKGLEDFFKAIFGWKTGLLVWQIGGVGLSTLIGITRDFIWDPPSGAFLFIILILSESLTGTWVAVRVKKEKFNYRKFYNIAPKLVAHIGLLAFSYNIGAHSALLFWLPNATFGWFASRNFIAVYLNLVEMKLVKGEFAEYIKRRLMVEDTALMETIEKDLKPEKEVKPNHIQS